MSDNIQITTTVSLDCAGNANQMVIHLVQGDYGVRALRLIPVNNGSLMDMSQFASAKVMLACAGHEILLIDCEMGDRYATLVPTPAMVSSADEWAAQLQLTKENGSVTSAPFTVIVHGTVYNGDTVEHTNSRVLAAHYDSSGNLNIDCQDDVTIVTDGNTNLYTAIRTALSAYMMTDDNKTTVQNAKNWLDQSVKTDASPKYEGLQIGGTWNASTGKWEGGVSINADGTISGAIFT